MTAAISGALHECLSPRTQGVGVRACDTVCDPHDLCAVWHSTFCGFLETIPSIKSQVLVNFAPLLLQQVESFPVNPMDRVGLFF